jgi:triacylglycerol esterase/lipase EstA (alpha/beta hydrolase family)
LILQGSRNELRLVSSHLKLLHSEQVHYYRATSLEQYTLAEGIESLGERLATEISEYIDHQFPKNDDLKKISFVGHSMGGVIIRSAIKNPKMTRFYPILHTFISLR